MIILHLMIRIQKNLCEEYKVELKGNLNSAVGNVNPLEQNLNTYKVKKTFNYIST